MNIWTGLLFLEGAVADTGLARDLASADGAAPSGVTVPGEDDTRNAREALAADRLFTAGGLH